MTDLRVELPRRLGPFLLLRHLASGGMGDVFLAHQRLGVVERLCVVKTARPELAATPGLLRRFVDEARTSALLTHKNIASVIDVGEADGTAYIAVEYVAGRDVQTVWKRARRVGQPIPENVALYIVGELLDALAYVHRATDPRTGEPLHIVHRDVSPQNVLVSFEGEVKLIDFGIARSNIRSEQTQTGQALGKIRYMSPEQAKAMSVDGATDVYATAILACELLTGRRYYGDLSMESVAVLLASEAPPPPGALDKIPSALQRVLRAALAADPRQRPTASQLKEQLLAAQLQRMTLGSSEGLREYLDGLFEGEKSKEHKARAELLQEPTTVRAERLHTGMPGGDDTAVEDTPISDVGVDRDAPTASRASVAREREQLTKVVRHEALDASAEPATGTAPSRAVKRPKGPSPSVLAAAVGALVVAVIVVVALALAVFREPAKPPRPVIVVETPAIVDPPVVDPPPVDPPPADPPPVDPPPVDPPPVEQAIEKPVEQIVDKPVEKSTPRPRPKKTSTPAERPELFGDRVRALRACSPRPSCAGSVLERAADVGSLSIDELKDLDEDVDRCLAKCR